MKYFITTLFCLLALDFWGQSPRMIYPVGNAWVSTASFSSDGKYLLTIKNYHTVDVWSTATGFLLYSIPMSWYTNAYFNPNAKSLITLNKGDIIVTILSSGKQERIMNIGEKPGTIRRVSGDAGIIAIYNDGNERDSIDLWSNPEGKLLMSIKGSADEIRFTKDNRYVVTLFRDSCIKWDLVTHQEIYSFPLDNFTRRSISPDGKYAIATNDKVINIWEAATGVLKKTLNGPGAKLNAYNFSDNGSGLLSIWEDSTAILWDIETGKMTGRFRWYPEYYCKPFLSPDGKKIAILGKKGNMILYETGNGKATDSIRIGTDFLGQAFKFSPDSKSIAFLYKAPLTLYSTDTKQSTRLQDAATDIVASVLVTPGNKYLLINCGDTATLCETGTGKILAKMTMNRSGFDCVFNENSTRMLMWDGRDISLWEIPGGKLLNKIEDSGGKIGEAFINYDGTRMGIVTGSYIAIWESNGVKSLKLIPHNKSLREESTVFSRNGNYMLTAHGDSVLLYRSDSGIILQRFVKGKTDNDYEYVYISPDDRFIMTHDKQHQQAAVWDVRSGKKLYMITGNNPTFTMDSAYIIAGETVYVITSGKAKETLPDPETKYLPVVPSMKYKATIASENGKEWKMVKVTENKTGHAYYLMLQKGKNLLVFDEFNHFDGTAEARSLLHIACGDRVINDKNVLDKLWVPGLAEKIMKGETINAKKLEELNICEK